MNYKKHYDKLIERASGRELSGYVERHHIVPRCMGGLDDSSNIVVLTAEEHYVAHQLLAKMHPQEQGLVTAAVRMAKQCTGRMAYGWLRKRHAERFRGKPISESHRSKISKTLTGKKRKPFTAEHLKNLSLSHKGQPHTPLSDEARARISAAKMGHTYNLGRKNSPEARNNMRLARLAYLERLRAAQ